MASEDVQKEKLGVELRAFAAFCWDALLEFLRIPPGKQRMPTIIAWAAGIAVILGIIQRFRFGADLTDESFGLAMPYRFALGDKAFSDEISIQQTAAIILYPFIWLFVKITRGSTYIVLYTRMIHIFVFRGVGAIGVYLAGRRLLKTKAAALAVAFVPFGFVPAGIPNVGYNVIGLSILAAGTFWSYVGVSKREPNYYALAFAGFLLAVTAWSYPPMFVAPILATPLVFICAPTKRFSATAAFIAGGLALVLLLLPMLRYGGIAGIRRALNWGIHAQQVRTLAGLKATAEAIVERRPVYTGWCFIAVTIAALTRSRILTAIVVPAVTIYFIVWNKEEVGQHMATLHQVMYFGFFAPAMVLIARPDANLLRLAALVLVPSFACAVMGGFLSTQGPDSSCHGFHASLILFALCAVRALEQARVEGAFAFTPAFVMSFSLVARMWEFQYRDAPIAALTERVVDGPFKGIYTSADRAKAFAEMSQIERRYDHPPSRVLILYEMSGYYLWWKMKPGAHCVWEVPYADTEGINNYWQPRTTGQGIVIKVNGSGQGVLDPILTPPERLLMRTPHFSVYRDQ